MPRSFAKVAWYETLKIYLQTFAIAVLRIRAVGINKIPPEGGALLATNHQSQLDPPLFGMCVERRLNYLARDTLFKFLPFRWLIQSLDAIPIDREGTGLSGLKETMRRLKNGEIVLIFPEGTRTRDGEVGPLKPGFCAVARRTKTPIIPGALDGAYQSWPRTARLPRPERVIVVYGDPIWPHEIDKLTDEALVEEVTRRIRACHAEARRLRER